MLAPWTECAAAVTLSPNIGPFRIRNRFMQPACRLGYGRVGSAILPKYSQS